MYFIISLVACFFLSINAQDTPPAHLNELLVADLADIPFTKDVSKGKFTEPPSFNSIFKVEKAGFSLYLWPREECSVVELIGVESIKNEIPFTGNEKIVFTAMEQRVAYYVWELPEEENIKITTEMPTTEQPTTETPTTVTVVTTADATAPPTTETAAPTTGAPVPTPEAPPADAPVPPKETTPVQEAPAQPPVEKKVLRKRQTDKEGGSDQTPGSGAGGVQTENLGEKLPDETGNKESKEQGDGERTDAPLTEASPSTPTVASTAEPTTEPTTPLTTTMTTTTPKPPAKRWVFKKAEYYPYVKVDFNEKEGQYRLKVRGSQDEGKCDVSKCLTEESEIAFNSTKDILIMTNSPYCETFVLSRKQETVKSNSFLRPKIEDTRLVPLNGIDTTGSIKKTIDVTKKCCPSPTNGLRLPHEIPWYKNDENALAMHYKFMHTKTDVYHTSFLIEMVDAGSCDWIRLCFNKDDCKNGHAVLDILPRSGLLIRPDDDKAEYLGEHGDIINKLRVSVSETMVVLRYGGIHRDSSGIHTPIYLKQSLGNELHVWLLKSAGCQARLNNDYIPKANGIDEGAAARVMKYNNLELAECKCFSQA